MPLSAELFGLYGRSDPRSWTLGGRLDGRGANLPLSSLGRLGLRPHADPNARRRALVAPLAIRAMDLPLRLKAAAFIQH